MIGKLTQKLFKTREGIIGKLAASLKSHQEVNQDLFDELEEILIGGDIGVTTALQLIENVRQQTQELGIKKSENIMRFLKSAMLKAFEGNGQPAPKIDDSYFQPQQRPFVIMVVGVNGTGKTTTIGKLAWQFKKHGNTNNPNEVFFARQHGISQPKLGWGCHF